ncbi:hypothetical protein [Turneriella parva]|uniref:Uncharacterized protein n=1 Tax=Turneriella parva (strain ATCC BAA-1111 / DSM 21527 / NCTC 11395 / H) TaxID=869212 RepID=I4BA45_TURPD|nr:hypothetical protein [Turneriella parva]AFM14152.1 hypothetical protein Turpa_3515 [Turneriella parva DSM 21527]
MSSNIFKDSKTRDFWVWIDPTNFMTKHQVTLAGSFTSAGTTDTQENLMFTPNPNFRAAISPFQSGLTIRYIAEYNLEIHRKHSFMNYPSRLQAIFLFDSEAEANKYRERHMAHVGNRLLKKVKTYAGYTFSRHDSSWVDFMRIGHSMDSDTIRTISESYWRGDATAANSLKSMGQDWSQDPIYEILFIGRVDFYDKSLPISQNGV